MKSYNPAGKNKTDRTSNWKQRRKNYELIDWSRKPKHNKKAAK